MIQDFKCTYGNSAGIREAVTNRTNLTFPDAYKHAETMAELAQVLKECDKAPFCELPFCHTVEAEAMGGIINYGNEKTGPRAKEYLCTDIEEILELPAINFAFPVPRSANVVFGQRRIIVCSSASFPACFTKS